MKILVIEDDPTVGQFVKRGFEEQRWGVDLVANGAPKHYVATYEQIDLLAFRRHPPKIEPVRFARGEESA